MGSTEYSGLDKSVHKSESEPKSEQVRPPSSVVAKFRVSKIEKDVYGYHKKGDNIKMHVVPAGLEPWDENTSFFNSTPTGSIEMNCVNPVANALFEENSEYYVIFTKA